jgi:hypothetical protein
MTAEPLLLLGWLLLAHLAADFLFQTGGIARGKTEPGRRGWTALAVHGAVVALCLVPVGLAFGAPGWAFLVVSAASHVAIDRVKIDLTRRVQSRSADDGSAAAAPTDLDQPVAGLGPAWTPIPAALFAVDQLAHLAVLGAGWAVLLAQAPLASGWTEVATSALAGWDEVALHGTVLTAVVLASLAIVNVRAGALFVAVLVGSRLVGRRDARATRRSSAGSDAPPVAARPSGWVVRIGPLVGRVDPDAPPSPPPPAEPDPTHHPPASPGRVGEAIGILERLLVVTFVLARAEAAIGLVIAAKTLARFRQLDDRDFAEYYLLGTLASVAIAVVTGFLAAAALATVQ